MISTQVIITSTDGDLAAFAPIIRVFSEWTDVLKSRPATLAARVDAADYEVLLGDRLRAEGLAAPPKKKRGRASSDDDDAALPVPTGQRTTRAERAAKRAKREALTNV